MKNEIPKEDFFEYLEDYTEEEESQYQRIFDSVNGNLKKYIINTQRIEEDVAEEVIRGYWRDGMF